MHCKQNQFCHWTQNTSALSKQNKSTHYIQNKYVQTINKFNQHTANKTSSQAIDKMNQLTANEISSQAIEKMNQLTANEINSQTNNKLKRHTANKIQVHCKLSLTNTHTVNTTKKCVCAGRCEELEPADSSYCKNIHLYDQYFKICIKDPNETRLCQYYCTLI